MRVLLYCDDPGNGGTAVNASLLAAGLADQGFVVGLAASTDLTAGADQVYPCLLGYDTQRLFGKTLYSRNEAEAAFLSFKPDMVLFCDGAPNSSLAAKAVCRDWGLPYVILVNYVAPSHILALADQREAVVKAYDAALVVVAVSIENICILRTFFNVSSERSLVIHYGRPAAFFTSPPAEERERRRRWLGLRPDDVLCLTVARYEPRKGYRHLLAAIRLLAGHPAAGQLRFAWIGHDIDGGGERLVAQVAVSGLCQRVAVLGQRDDVREWMAAADVFVLPSESEGMPLCVVEAMGQGLPVVATAVSGVPEQIGEAGLLVPDPNQDAEATARAMARAVADLALDPQRRTDLGRAARIRAEAMFTAEAMVAAYADLLRSLSDVVFCAQRRFPELGVYRPPHIVPFGRNVPVGDDAAAGEFLRDGWGHGEGEGRWTVGNRASLVMVMDNRDNGFVLGLRVRPFLGSSDRTVGMEVRCDGRTLGRFFWTGEAVERDLEMAVFPKAVGFEVQIEFLISGASSPFSHGQSDDIRVLGIWLSYFRVDRLTTR